MTPFDANELLSIFRRIPDDPNMAMAGFVGRLAATVDWDAVIIEAARCKAEGSEHAAANLRMLRAGRILAEAVRGMAR